MANQPLTRSAAKHRRLRQRAQRRFGLLLSAMVISVLAGVLVFKPAAAPQSNSETFIPTSILGLPSPTLLAMAQTQESPTVTADIPTPTPTMTSTLPAQVQAVTYASDVPILYYAQSGDSLEVLAVHFGVEMNEITSINAISEEGFISPNQLLLVPSRLEKTSSNLKLIPDTEVVNSPSSIDFNIDEYISEAGGYLSTYSDYLASSGKTSGADIINKVSLEYSVSPRLMLALLEYQSGWVYGQPESNEMKIYPMGYVNDSRKGLFNQCAWAAGQISDGYYGWREGRVVAIAFPDATVLRLAPELNSGTVGLLNLFSHLYQIADWGDQLYGSGNFIDFYTNMFGNPWLRAVDFEPLFLPEVKQPEFILPIEAGKIWAFTGGPHAAWGVADVWAALDFAPPSDSGGCIESPEWVLAAAAGLIVRSENGAVVIDMDGDGYEQTGWNIVYMHIATKNRIELNTQVNAGDRIGHPSCEGGRSTGTHVHIARKYNGEWVPADGPLTFNLGGWKAIAGSEEYKGWLVKDDKIIRANTAATYDSQIRVTD